MFDWMIVGAGFTGATLAEQIASQLNQTVMVVERRDHIGGNAYDYLDEHGILVHKYGPHIFHTNSSQVWDYLSRFTDWLPYNHHVLAVIDGKKIPLPFNLNSLHALFPHHTARRLEALLLERFDEGVHVPILELRASNMNGDLGFLADFIYEKVFYGYTLKQWELTPDELDPSVTARVPVRVGRDNRYFLDRYQAMPKHGYTEMFRKMLSHPNIEVVLNTDYTEIIDVVKFNRMIYTGEIDAFCGFVYGELPYRSMHFEFKHISRGAYQEVAQVNYPNDHDFTRITEFKHMTAQQASATTIAVDYPRPCRRGRDDPHYPIPMPENQDLYNRYVKETHRINGNVLFAGRLADYKYYNMDEAVRRALDLFETKVAAPAHAGSDSTGRLRFRSHPIIQHQPLFPGQCNTVERPVQIMAECG